MADLNQNPRRRGPAGLLPIFSTIISVTTMRLIHIQMGASQTQTFKILMKMKGSAGNQNGNYFDIKWGPGVPGGSHGIPGGDPWDPRGGNPWDPTGGTHGIPWGGPLGSHGEVHRIPGWGLWTYASLEPVDPWDPLAIGAHWRLGPIGAWGPLFHGTRVFLIQWPLGPRAHPHEITRTCSLGSTKDGAIWSSLTLFTFLCNQLFDHKPVPGSFNYDLLEV